MNYEPCEHLWETLEDGSQICFICDERRPAPPKTPFKLVCVASNHLHVRFNVFDPHGANCGQLCILQQDLIPFMDNWKGIIEIDLKNRTRP